MILFFLLAAITSTTATATADLRKAQCGDTVTLAAGQYGAIAAPRVICPDDNRLEIRAEAASFTTITVRAVQGVDWYGGFVSAPLGVNTAGVTIDASRFVRVAGVSVQGHKVGITAVRGSDYEILGNRMEGLRSDGINVTMAQRVRIEGNQVVNTVPIRASYDAKGKLLVDGDHADCIQFWTTYGQAPTTDMLIRGNYCRGEMQGIVSFDVGKGGPARVTIEGNLLDGLEYWNGITVYQPSSIVIRGNTVTTRRGARAQNYPFAPIKTWIFTRDATDRVVCGNIVPAMPGGEGTAAC